MQTITTFLTFKNKGKEAVDLYVSIFRNSHVNHATMHPDGSLLHASFVLDGQEFMAMDGGDHFKFEDGTSLFVTCETQDEIDYFWEKLTENGGEPGQCGWLKDKFGVSWQIVPKLLGELMMGPNPAKSQRVMEALLQMQKIDMAKLQQANDND